MAKLRCSKLRLKKSEKCIKKKKAMTSTLLRNIRLAFLAIWHPRAGNEKIRGCVSKDIGKQIARNYLTIENLELHRKGKVTPYDKLDQYVFHVEEVVHVEEKARPFDTCFNTIRCYNASLAYKRCESLLIQSPTMTLAFDFHLNRGSSMLTFDVTKQARFTSLLKSIDQQIRNQDSQYRECVSTVKDKPLYNITGEYTDNVMKIFHLHLRMFEISVFLSQTTRISLKDAIDQKVFTRGTRLKVIFGGPRLWEMGMGRCGMHWHAKQILIVKQAKPLDCAFIDWDKEFK